MINASANGCLCRGEGGSDNPTSGFDVRGGMELAGPPGDVGFVRVTWGAGIHLPISAWTSATSAATTTTTAGNADRGNVRREGEDRLGSSSYPSSCSSSSASSKGLFRYLMGEGGGMSLHGNLDLGMIHPIAYGGLCPPPPPEGGTARAGVNEGH